MPLRVVYTLARFLRTPSSLGASVFPHLYTVFFVFLSTTIGVTFLTVFSFPICTRVRVRAPFCLRWCCSLKNWFRRFEVSLALAAAVGRPSSRLPPPGGARGGRKTREGSRKRKRRGPREMGASRRRERSLLHKGSRRNVPTGRPLRRPNRTHPASPRRASSLPPLINVHFRFNRSCLTQLRRSCQPPCAWLPPRPVPPAEKKKLHCEPSVGAREVFWCSVVPDGSSAQTGVDLEHCSIISPSARDSYI